MNELKGIHHVTAITSSAEKNYEFFTNVLGMRLVKKTVNQDDIQTYHLFFADDKGSAGTDMTFFDFPGIPKGTHGTNEIFKTAFRVPTDEALHYWIKRFDKYDVKHRGIKEQFGKKTLSFVDFDDQQYMLISDEHNEGIASGTPWQNGPVPLEFAITGLGPIHIRIADFDRLKEVLEKAMLMREIDQAGSLHLFEMGQGGNGAQVVVEHNLLLPSGRQGFGTVHHVAFRVEDTAALNEWIERMQDLQFNTSGYVDLRIVVCTCRTRRPVRMGNRWSRFLGRRAVRNSRREIIVTTVPRIATSTNRTNGPPDRYRPQHTQDRKRIFMIRRD